MEKVIIRQVRFDVRAECTKSVLIIPDMDPFFVLEPPFRESVLSGNTAIAPGLYPLGLRRELTPLTQKYRDKYSFFTWHIEILGVPGHTDVYFHVGNSAKDTLACQLLGDSTRVTAPTVEYSALAFARFYTHVRSLLEREIPVYLQIKFL